MYIYVNLCICVRIFINVINNLYYLCVYIFRPIKIPSVEKAVSSVRGRGISRVRGGSSCGRGHGHGRATGSTVPKEDKQPIKQPLSSDPETISEEDDIKEISVQNKPQDKGQQKAHRGKPFKVAWQIHKPNLKKCTIALDRKDVEEKVEENMDIEEPIKKEDIKKQKVVSKKKIVVKEQDMEKKNTKTEKIDNNKKEVEEITNVVDEDKKQEPDLENIGDDNVEENVAREGSFTMETVAVYVNNVNDGSMIQDLSDSLKMTTEEQKQAVRDSFHIQNLEKDIEKILDNRLKVKDTKERIKRLEVILELLRRFPEGDKEEFTNEGKSDMIDDKKDIENAEDRKEETGENIEKGINENVVVTDKQETEKPSDGYVKSEKHVRFELVDKDEKEVEERNNINEKVEKVIEVVSLGIEDTKIDKEYEDFPSSQVSGEKYAEKMKEKYSVETEDITDEEIVETSENKEEVTKKDVVQCVEKKEEEIESEKDEKDRKCDDFTNNEQKQEIIKEDETEVESEKVEEKEESRKEDETKVESENVEEKEDIIKEDEKDNKIEDFTNNEEKHDSSKEAEKEIESEKVEEDKNSEGNDKKEDEDEESLHEKEEDETGGHNDPDLIYESGSDYEENLVEKWKQLKDGDKLNRYIF